MASREVFIKYKSYYAITLLKNLCKLSIFLRRKFKLNIVGKDLEIGFLSSSPTLPLKTLNLVLHFIHSEIILVSCESLHSYIPKTLHDLRCFYHHTTLLLQTGGFSLMFFLRCWYDQCPLLLEFQFWFLGIKRISLFPVVF